MQGYFSLVSTMEAQPIATVAGEVYAVPHDLYIPPDALKVFLETFEGPLDLLLYLIKKQKLDILNIPVAEITRQYQQYIDLMQELQLELVAEYLVMAAMLAEIKSRLLLPQHIEGESEEDPRAELVKRLQEYEQFKQAAERLDELPRVDRDVFIAQATPLTEIVQTEKNWPSVDLNDLVSVLRQVLAQAELRTPHLIHREILSIRAKMTQVLQCLQEVKAASFDQLLVKKEGRQGVVVTLIAILELLKQAMIIVAQKVPYGEIELESNGTNLSKRLPSPLVEEVDVTY